MKNHRAVCDCIDFLSTSFVRWLAGSRCRLIEQLPHPFAQLNAFRDVLAKSLFQVLVFFPKFSRVIGRGGGDDSRRRGFRRVASAAVRWAHPVSWARSPFTSIEVLPPYCQNPPPTPVCICWKAIKVHTTPSCMASRTANDTARWWHACREQESDKETQIHFAIYSPRQRLIHNSETTIKLRVEEGKEER